MTQEHGDADVHQNFEQVLGNAAEDLMDSGLADVAAILLDCRILRFDHRDSLFRLPLDDSPPVELVDAWLEAPRAITTRLSEEHEAQILGTLNSVLEPERIWVKELRWASPTAPADWREQIARRLGEGPRNQATLGPVPPPISEDRLMFRSRAEIAVYRALKRAQGKRPQAENVTVLALPSARINGNTLEPDFVVLYRGRAGIIEVDGPHHIGKRASDTSRDRIFRYCGVKEVDHFDVADVDDEAELDKLIEGFLWRLGNPH